MTNPNGDYQPDNGEYSGPSDYNNHGQQYNPYNQQANYQPQYGQGYAPQPNMGAYPVQPQYVAPGQQKSWIATLLLCFFLGWFGAHNFYTGRTTFGVSQLVLNILGWATFWFLLGFAFWAILGLWVFIEFIMIIAGAGDYDKDARGVPLAK
ncbi:TM2 domain-containing protein [Corynebacterium aurimucosum]|uniref:TM2 domain-containing protein n=1 Tax=Corynebacterium aurimucosum TaxID=169292 RepID=UPI00066CA5CF|nr:TM2 domain-containing protein [Corynebacterium aurimucosum]